MSDQHSYPHHSTRAGCIKHSMCQQGVPMTLAGVRRPRTNRRKGIPWRRFFRLLATYLNLMVIVGIWISARYPTGSLAVSSSEWAPNFLHDAWGSACFACRGNMKTYLKIAAPESFCLEALHGILMVVFVVLG
ncbi:uncharacterized protein MELLADRAFT_111634 [Melampsora larici-populina 98AG31]|uniref:Uncharacterized protein n=1 Tax=Melampsora larici-populina (strain 98AG31 / pathotype 3-4-7) TaxID=747676 RepID=F4S3U6_MELLP|nr:uncharacterized protein MELLADRAFT_111634 [Melampsora larici-populina 98AG31]EGG00736.1 hypothetical protein MELLADRAFT_111634 [Melampsora larici-populina 98AG31]